MQTIPKILVALLSLAISATPVFADGGGGGGRDSHLKPYQKLIDDKQYQKAIDELGKALAKKSKDADLLNLMAYSHRQLEKFDIALDYYLKALEIKPKHRGANEYLGELYLQMGELEKAEQRLAVLDDACFFGCNEYDELEEAIEEYKKRNPS